MKKASVLILIIIIGGTIFYISNADFGSMERKKKGLEDYRSYLNNTSTSTQQTEKASGIITGVHTSSTKNYIDIDYVTFRHNPGDMPWGSIVNDNPKIRTFELSPNVLIRSGVSPTDAKPISLEEFKNIFKSNNDYRKENPWSIVVKDGVVTEIVEVFRS